MSHWIRNRNIYTIKRAHVDVMESVFGHNGFSRSSVDSIGINIYIYIYTGMTKSSPRVISSPVVPKDEVLISQLWNVMCDVTYSPISNKIFNLLTNQAGGVMAASNSLLDRFYGVVLSRLYPDIDSNERPSHRRCQSLQQEAKNFDVMVLQTLPTSTKKMFLNRTFKERQEGCWRNYEIHIHVMNQYLQS